MPKVKLTVRSVEAAQPQSKDLILQDAELANFGLKVTPKGKKSFFVYYRTADHVQRRPTIGHYPALRPEQARRIAQDMFAEVRKGLDPSAERQAKRRNKGDGTVAELFTQYIAYKRRHDLKSISQVERIFQHDILPTLGKKKAEAVKAQEITRLLDKVEARSVASALAARRQLSAFYKWAMSRLPDGASNPVVNASRPPSLRSRDRVLDGAELRELWRVLEAEKEPWRTALKLMILTGQRRTEVLAADWSEFDLGQQVWTIPRDRAKSGKAHIVPLSQPVVDLLQGISHRSGPLFPKGTGPVGRVAKRIRESMAGVPHWRWHDLRRTVATGMQRLGVKLEVTEAVLGHTSGSRGGIVQIYQRHDYAAEKRAALNMWAEEVHRTVMA